MPEMQWDKKGESPKKPANTSRTPVLRVSTGKKRPGRSLTKRASLGKQVKSPGTVRNSAQQSPSVAGKSNACSSILSPPASMRKFVLERSRKSISEHSKHSPAPTDKRDFVSKSVTQKNDNGHKDGKKSGKTNAKRKSPHGLQERRKTTKVVNNTMATPSGKKMPNRQSGVVQRKSCLSPTPTKRSSRSQTCNDELTEKSEVAKSSESPYNLRAKADAGDETEVTEATNGSEKTRESGELNHPSKANETEPCPKGDPQSWPSSLQRISRLFSQGMDISMDGAMDEYMKGFCTQNALAAGSTSPVLPKVTKQETIGPENQVPNNTMQSYRDNSDLQNSGDDLDQVVATEDVSLATQAKHTTNFVRPASSLFDCLPGILPCI